MLSLRGILLTTVHPELVEGWAVRLWRGGSLVFILLAALLLCGAEPALSEVVPEQSRLPDAAPPEEAPAPPAQAAELLVLFDDDISPDSSLQGAWLWDDQIHISGGRSHWHPAQPGRKSHGLTLAKPIAVPYNSFVFQQVWLDPQDPPAGIALKLVLAGGREVGVYWEGEEEVFTPDGFEELWYYGFLPEFGRWIGLEILAEDMGIEGKEIAGLAFVTHGGRVLWDKTSLKELPEEEKEGLAEVPAPKLPTFGGEE